MVSIPFLREPVFRDGSSVRYGGSEEWTEAEFEESLLDRVFEGGVRLDDLAQDMVSAGLAGDVGCARKLLTEAFADPNSPIGLIDLDIAAQYDMVVVDQGYAGVYVNTIEILKRIGKRWSFLLVSPVNPLFENIQAAHIVTRQELSKRIPGLSYFSYVHIVRSIVALTQTKLLLLTHRSQSLFLSDLIAERPTVIYCDGYYDGFFRLAPQFHLRHTRRMRRRVLSEVYFHLSNTDPNFSGISSTPAGNRYLLMAGFVSLRDARENWVWGQEQLDNFRRAFPNLRRPVRFMPPFTNPEIFQPERVDRERRVLFTTTMHNIEKKGFPELVKAMRRMPSLRVRCVVRQPERLPPYPSRLKDRLEIGPVSKEEMIELYHRMWRQLPHESRGELPGQHPRGDDLRAAPDHLPAVAAQIPIIEDGKTGFVVHPDDERGLIRALRTLLENRRLRDEMGREARRRAEKYSLENRITAFERFLA